MKLPVVKTCAEIVDPIPDVGDCCPNCGAPVEWSVLDLTVLECSDGCGWACRDDPDAKS
jgi:hypothetical protein